MKTQLVNHFLVNESWCIVYLPGFVRFIDFLVDSFKSVLELLQEWKALKAVDAMEAKRGETERQLAAEATHARRRPCFCHFGFREQNSEAAMSSRGSIGLDRHW